MSFKDLNTRLQRVRRFRGLTLLLALFAVSDAWGLSSSRVPDLTPLSSPAGQVFLNRDEALKLAFPDCKIERSTAYLNAKQIKRVASLSKGTFKSSVVYPYRASKEGKWVGTAYFDTHRVRSLRETLLVVVKPAGTLGRIEVLSFAEPREYLPRDKWYDQFTGLKLDSELNLGRKIRSVTGATLTSSASTLCARRVLALDLVLRENAQAKPKIKPGQKTKKPPVPLQPQ